MSVLRGLGTALPVTLMIIFYSVLPSVLNRQFIIQTHHIILQLIVLDLLQILNHHPACPLHTHDHLLHPGPGRNPQGHQLHLHPGRGRPEPATNYQQPTTYQQFCSGTGSGSALNFSGLVPVLAEKRRNIAGFTDKLWVKPAICCWFRFCFFSWW